MKLIGTIFLFVSFMEFCYCFHGSGTTVPFEHMDRWMVIDYHNTLRRDVHASNMQEMSWDRLAARAARKYSRKCDFYGPKDDLYGENVFYSSSKPNELPKEVMMDAIQYWSKDKNETNNARQHCGSNMECNYLKMITANTEGVGCSIAKCPVLKLGDNKREANVNLVACFYIPRINITSRVPYRSGIPCTHCKSGFSCRNKLCAPPTVPVSELKFGSHFDSNVIELEVDVKTLQPPKPTATLLSKPEVKIQFRETLPATPDPATSRWGENRSPGSNYRGSSQAELRRRSMSRRYFDRKGHLRLRQTPPSSSTARDTVVRGTSSRSSPSGDTLPQRQRPSYSRNRSSSRRSSSLRRNNRRFEELVSGTGRVKRQALYDPYAQRRRERERLLRERERQRRQRQRQPASRNRRQQEEERRRRLEERERQQRERQARRRQDRRQQPGRTNRVNRDRSPSRTHGRQRRPQSPGEIAAMTNNDHYYLLQMHNTIRTDGLPKLEWSSRLERWAKYVIRCDIQYPGPSNCYTNFGKIDSSKAVYNIVYDWSSDVEVMRGTGGNCRTPEDRAPCNRNTNMKSEFIREMACAALSCGRQRQVTCIYQ